MTNLEIIFREAVANKIYTTEEATEIILQCGELPLHTFQAWKAKGYSVKKGEKATITTQLWKFRTFKKVNEDGDEEEQEKCYLCKSCLFTAEQVEEIKKREA